MSESEREKRVSIHHEDEEAEEREQQVEEESDAPPADDAASAPDRWVAPSLSSRVPFRENDGVRGVGKGGLAAALALMLAACGSSGGSSSSSSSAKNGSALVAEISHPNVQITGDTVIASAQVRVGGVPGKHVTLKWGLVDALLGNESQEERVIRRYVTTRKVVTDTESVRIPLRLANTPLLVHFVVYAPDGTYLASVDTHSFGKGS
jgi:hypothetical protein